MRYFISRQLQWMTGSNVVEIAAGGLDYSGPDMLSDPGNIYGPLGDMLETSDPREALKAAFAIRKAWHEELRAAACADPEISDEIHIEVGYNLDMITPTENPTDEQLHEWAQMEWEAAPKCYWCNEVIEEPYRIPEIDEIDVQFCSEWCANRCWAKEVYCEDK